MESYLASGHYDLVTPDGRIASMKRLNNRNAAATIHITGISPAFVGYDIPLEQVFFNLKSTLAQLGLHTETRAIELERRHGVAHVQIDLRAIGDLAAAMLDLLSPGAYIGKLFAADERRRVRDPDYLMRMFGRSDRKGRPLLSLGGFEGSNDLILEKTKGRTVAFLSLRDGIVTYETSIYGFLPTLSKALHKNLSHTRQLLHLHHYAEPHAPRRVSDDQILLVRTAPLHVRTVYGRVVDELLPQGFRHTSASVLQPDTTESGDIYELYGNSNQILADIPLEFYTLEPHREHVFFSDRDQLLSSLENPQALFDAFDTAPKPHKGLAAVFVVKGTQLKALEPDDWICREVQKHAFPGLAHPSRQAQIVERYIEQQPAYPFLKAIEDGLITSQGVLLARHFPTPLLKQMLLNDHVLRCLKRIYFESPSSTYDQFFSQEDRAMLVDLAKFGLPVFWVDRSSNQVLQYVLRPKNEAGMFVPVPLVETFRKATVLGVYGSNLLRLNFEPELRKLVEGLLALRSQVNHPLLGPDIPLALVTGGGPGAMEVGNRVARNAGILSCANIVDFRPQDNSVVSEQTQNPYVDAKMTYRLDRLVERQAEFYLDLPILLPGGVGTDFEHLLEEVRRKTGACPANPILLFGETDYWRAKITSRFQMNRASGTIRGSEWISNCFYCVQTAAQALSVLERFFRGTLPIGRDGPVYPDGFCHPS